MNARPLAALLLAAASSGAARAAETETAATRAARFHAAGLERPLLELRRGARLLQVCAERLRRGCTQQQRRLAPGNRMVVLLDALTLFPQRPPADPAAGIRTPGELQDAIDATSAALLQAAGDYDRQVFARYGAALTVCPDPDEDAARFHASVDELMRLDFGAFLALTDADAAQARAAVARDTAELEPALRALPAADCTAIRVLGWYLLELLHSKLAPWSGPDPQATVDEPRPVFGAAPRKPAPEKPAAPARDLAYAVAGNYVSVVATELQLTAHPESAREIKAIADAVEGSTPAP